MMHGLSQLIISDIHSTKATCLPGRLSKSPNQCHSDPEDSGFSYEGGQR